MKGRFSNGIIEFFKSAFQSSSSQPDVPTEEDISDYEKKLRNEQRFYKDCTNVHELPEIFHYWSNKYLAPELHRFGFTNPNELFSFYIEKYLADKSGQTTRVLSIGSGNCDLELEISRKLVEQGHKDFVIECLDLNQDMLERGTNAANEAGLGDCFVFTRADFNKWNPTAKYGIVLANQSLHHVLNLEGLFDSVRQSLEPDGLFLICDMIGRNGHMRWPEAMDRLAPFWDELPESYRYNQLIKRHEQQYINHDCSTEGFEGIRAQDILPLLLERFNFDFFFPFGNMIFVFIDRPFGHSFDADADWDRDFIDRVHAKDEACFISGELKPTSMLAVLTCSKSETVLRHPTLTPQHCVRPPDQIVEGPAKQSPDEIRLYSDIQKLNTDLSFLRRPHATGEQFEDLEYDPDDSTELTVMKNRVAGLQGHIREYENSTSWRITRPLRALKQRLTGKD